MTKLKDVMVLLSIFAVCVVATIAMTWLASKPPSRADLVGNVENVR